MPVRRNATHINAVGPLYQLSEHAKVMSNAAFKQPLDDAARSDLLTFCIESLKAAGCTSTQVLSAVHAAFPLTITEMTQRDLPASIPTAAALAKADTVSTVSPEGVKEPPKSGGLFSRK